MEGGDKMGVRRMNTAPIVEETVKYNETYNCRMHKYTINIPIALFKEIDQKSKDAGFAELAPYIRAIIIKEAREGNTSLKDILGEKEARKQEYLVLNSNIREYRPQGNLLKNFNKLLAIFSN